MITGKLRIMGRIEVIESEGETSKFPMALLIEFESADDIRTALQDMECKFCFD